jgi:quercetin dioxygenase-like cupin family protein
MLIIKADELGDGTMVGAEHGSTVSLILGPVEPGQGPRLHRHPYDETWVVQEGNVTFRVGEDRHRAESGDIVLLPAGLPHGFTNDGPGSSVLVCIHASPTIITEWLE